MILLKKAIRSIWQGKRSYASCIALIALGIMSYVGFGSTGTKLMQSMDHMYAATNFGDAFAVVEGISPSMASHLARTPGVEQVGVATTANARFLHEGDAVLSLHVISYDQDEEIPMNRPLLQEGEMPRRGEIAVSQTFYRAQGLNIGDTVSLLSDGKQLRLTVSGVVLSPEYISEVGDGMSGDGSTSGYAYVPPEEAAALAQNDGMANYVTFRFSPGVTYNEAEAVLRESLERYGLRSIYGQEDHPGHYSTWLSFANLTSISGMLAVLFLLVAVLVLYILLRRVMEQERTQIGTMKALGYSGGKIVMLYMGYGGVVGFVGGVLGIAAGSALAVWFLQVYLDILLMPAVHTPLAVDLYINSMIISVFSGLIGAVIGARSVLRLSPAESMRPAAPPQRKKRNPRDRKSVLPATVFMAVRNIGRGRFRSAFIAGGLAVSFAILTLMSSYAAILDEVMMTVFEKSQQYDVKLTLTQPMPRNSAISSILPLGQVGNAEGMLTISAPFYNNHLSETVTLYGMDENSSMYRIYDSHSQKYIPLPDQEILISRAISDRLEARVGDTLTFTTGYTGKDRIAVTVAGIINENTGYAAYMNLDALCRLIGSEPAVNNLLLETSDPASIREYVTGADNVDIVYDKAEEQAFMQQELNSQIGVNVGLFAVIGLGIACAIIASSASISLSERSREYATLRVLGMGVGQIGKIMIAEYVILAAVALIPGIPMALGLRSLMCNAMSDQVLCINPNIASVHYIVGFLVCLIAVAMANISSIRQVARLEITEVLKERE